MLIEKTKNEKIEYMEVYLCDDYNRGWILIPIENKKEAIKRFNGMINIVESKEMIDNILKELEE